MSFAHRTLLLSTLIVGGVVAESAKAEPPATITLNTTSQEGAACRLTFTAQGGLDQLVSETVLFDRAGAVRLFTLFDFGATPAGGLRVRQFDVPDMACDDLGMVLINGLHACRTAGGGDCVDAPTFASRLETVEVNQ